jgi:diadenosine tetraphosphatase ApaH/serine/threonine PP2A family protein phosphatase
MLTYAIGDVHGCLDKLVRLLARCRAHAGDRPRRLVFVGDYIDRGPNSRGVIDTLLELQRKEPRIICLRGNHEAMMLDAIETGDEVLWLLNGGGQTLESYDATQALDLPAELVEWADGLPLSFDDGRRLFVHAGLNPRVPLDRQTEQDLLWIREPFLSSRSDFGRLIVHGHTPLRTGVPDLRSNRLNIDTAAVFGGPLTAAVFEEHRTEPLEFLTDV